MSPQVNFTVGVNETFVPPSVTLIRELIIFRNVVRDKIFFNFPFEMLTENS